MRAVVGEGVAVRTTQAAALVFFIVLCIVGRTVHAAPTVIEAGAAQNQFYIEPSYDGASVVLFGAVDSTRFGNQPFDIAVTLRGAVQPIIVWKKDRHAGLWVNSQRVIFDGVPNFFAVLSTRPIAEIAPGAVRDVNQLGIEALDLPIRAGDDIVSPVDREAFEAALIRQKKAAGLFVEQSAGAIDFLGSTLFRAKIVLPAAAGPGLYLARFYVFHQGEIVGEATARIRLRKVGIEARLSSAAHEHPWVYGVIAVVLAVAVGGGAAFLTRKI